MFNFIRVIEGTEISVCIDSQLYGSKREIFDSMLSTFKMTSNSSETSLLITGNINSEYENSYYCNTESERWVFYLQNMLEDYFAQILNCTVIHGACIKIFDKCVALVGERKSGKTTLTKFFMDLAGVEYLSDDCIYIVNGCYYGFNMPIPMRSALYPKGCVICSTLDDDNIKRLLYFPEKSFLMTKRIDSILFPKYEQSLNLIDFNKVSHVELFNWVINNTKHFSTTNKLFKDINNLLKTVSAYKVNYSNCEDVLEWFSGL